MATAEELIAAASDGQRQAWQLDSLAQTTRANGVASDRRGQVTVTLDSSGLPSLVTANQPGTEWCTMLGPEGFAEAVLEAAVTAAHQGVHAVGGWGEAIGGVRGGPPRVPAPEGGSVERSLDGLMRELDSAFAVVAAQNRQLWQDQQEVARTFVAHGTAPIGPSANGQVAVGLCRGGIESCTVTGIDLTCPPSGRELGDAVTRAIADARGRLGRMTDPTEGIVDQLNGLVADALAHLNALADGTHQICCDLRAGSVWAQAPSGLNNSMET